LILTKKRLEDRYAHADFQITIEDPRLVKDIRIYIDPRKDNHISLVLHELLHIYVALELSLDLKFNDNLEEWIVLSLESALFNYLRNPGNQKLLESWDRAIKRKLG
jgi:hypothetical protein